MPLRVFVVTAYELGGCGCGSHGGAAPEDIIGDFTTMQPAKAALRVSITEKGSMRSGDLSEILFDSYIGGNPDREGKCNVCEAEREKCACEDGECMNCGGDSLKSCGCEDMDRDIRDLESGVPSAEQAFDFCKPSNAKTWWGKKGLYSEGMVGKDFIARFMVASGGCGGGNEYFRIHPTMLG